MAWTEQQQNAIDARDSSIIVSAAAGSGKTAVLTERLVQLLSDPSSGVRADRIIVVTFTNDAAAELKKRLEAKLRSLINDNPSNEYLIKQQVLLQNAKISTINSFCFDFLRENISDQGITSGFTVLEEADNEVIRTQSMEVLFDWYSSNDYETISFLYDKFCLKDHSPLMRVIREMDRFLSSVALSKKWIDIAVKEYKKLFNESIYFTKLFESVKQVSKTALNLAEQNYSALNDIFYERENSIVEQSFKVAESDIQRAEKLFDLASNMKIPSKDELIYLSSFDSLPTIRSNFPHNNSLRELYKIRREKIKGIIKEALDRLYSAENDFEESSEVVVKLTDVVRKYREIIWNRKCERNAISFDDGERLVLDMLVEIDENGIIKQSECAKRTAELFDIIMIDEYQDSNNKEDLIFKLLTKEFKYNEQSQPIYGNNAFLVGDVKQSIYRFRLANPKNFIETMKFSEPFESDSKNKYILLNKNFRSSPEVINFVNYTFETIMSEFCGDINYNENEKLYFGAEFYGKPNKERKTILNLINTDPIESEDSEEIIECPEAEVTASKIAKMLSDKVLVIESEEKSHQCTPKDFCVLVRNNKFTKAYVTALEKRGILAKGSDEKGYLKSQEIAVLIDLLRIITNPLLDVPMAAVMVSPMFMFSITDLAYIKSFDNKMALYPLMKLAVDGKISGFDNNLITRCRDFLATIDRFRLDSVTMKIGELIASIYDTTDFIPVMQLRTDGEKKRANLRALIRYAQNYENSASIEGTGGLTGFIRHIDRILENGDYEQGKVSTSSGDYVTIQTFHKSKGLEYPFVFIAETSVQFKFDSKSVMCSDDGRIGFTLYDKNLLRRYKTFQQKMLKSENENDSRSEEMRLLYVGMTRAKQQLFINLSCGEKSIKRINSLVEKCVINNNNILSLIKESKCYADWIWICLMKNVKFQDIADSIGIEECTFGNPTVCSNEDVFNYEICKIEDVSSKEIECKDSAIPDNKIVERILKVINYKYDDSLTEVSAKLSVTQITQKYLKDDSSIDIRLSRPRFISGLDKLTGTERGTAVHSFFQYCDFSNAILDINSEIKRLVDLGYIDNNQASSLDKDKITAFFKSNLYSNIINSKGFEREKSFMVSASQLKLDDPIFNRISMTDGMIKGVIDLIYETEDGLVIVDYKSDRGVLEDEFKEKYSKQLQIYKAATELIMDKKVVGLMLYSIELEREIIII